MSAVRGPLSPAAAQLLGERYGVQLEADAVESCVDERFGQPFAWGTPIERAACPRCGGAVAVTADQAAETHTRELADELAAFDRYKANQTSFGEVAR